MSDLGADPPSSKALLRFIKKHRVLAVPAGWVSRAVASSSESSPVRVVLGPLRDRLRGAMKGDDVLGVLEALAANDVSFHVAGGWGVDALLGRQTRSHHDLDVVIDEYDRDLSRALDALAQQGYRLLSTYERHAWMPRRAVCEGPRGHRVELVSLNWDVLSNTLDDEAGEPLAPESLPARVFTTGTVGGRQVPCLSATVQLLFHTRFELPPSLAHDVRLLHKELGASLPGTGAT